MRVTIYLNTTTEVRPGCFDCANCGANGYGDPGTPCPRCGAVTGPLGSLAIFTRTGAGHAAQPGDELLRVASFDVDAPSAQAAAEEAFAIGNGQRAASADYYAAQGSVRSMSVGDIAVVDTIDGRAAFSCESAGWLQVDLRRFTVAG